MADASGSQPAPDRVLRAELARLDRILRATLPRPTGDAELDPRAAIEARFALDHADRIVAATRPDPQPPELPGLARTAQVYGLSAFDRDLLLLAAAPELDVGYGDLYRLVDGRAEPRLGFAVAVLVRAYGLPRDAALSRTAADAPLRRFGLIELRGESAGDRWIGVPELVWRRLIDADAGAVFEQPAALPLAAVVATAATTAAVERAAAWAHREGRGLVVVRGDAGTGRTAIARTVAAALDRRAILVDAPAAAALVAREARWLGAVPVIAEPGLVPAAPVIRDAGLAIVIARPDADVTEVGAIAAAGLPVFELAVEPLGRAERLALWRDACGDDLPGLDAIATRRMAPGRITAAARRARERATADGGTLGDHLAAARRDACREVTGAGVDVVEPRLTLADLVVTAQTRRELDLAVAWGRRLDDLPAAGGVHLAASGGLACLFWGPPGTGKSSAAQALAAALGLDLVRIDLARIVDKYIGETEKHLARVFDHAESNHVVLLFDEAEALFGRRTEARDAHDRFANIETGYLLQRLESFRGVAVLATNLRASLDPAFVRRMQIIAEFALPGPDERRELWRRCCPARTAPDLELDWLAGQFPLTGGDIRNAMLAAVVLAEGEPVAMRHAVIGLWRELARSGRLVDGSELGPWREVLGPWLAR